MLGVAVGEGGDLVVCDSLVFGRCAVLGIFYALRKVTRTAMATISHNIQCFNHSTSSQVGAISETPPLPPLS